MPSILAHSIHGQKVKNRLNRADINGDAFAWGLQGPDFLYYHRLLPWMKGESLKGLCARFHESGEGLLKGLSENGGALQRSYGLGLCCHFTLDAEADAYIGWMMGKLQTEGGSTEDLMNETASALDTVLIRHEEGKLANEVKLSACLPENEAVQRMAAAFYSLAAKDLLGLDIDEQAVFQATEDAVKAFAALTDHTALKKALAGKLKRQKSPRLSCLIRPMVEDNSFDYANISRALWQDKEGVSHETDFFELVEGAVDKALERIALLGL